MITPKESSDSPRTRVLALGLGGVAVLGFAALVVLNVVDAGWSALGSDLWLGILLVFDFTGLGTLLALRQPANPIGWLFSVGGLTWLFSEATLDFAQHALADGSHGTTAARLAANVDPNIWPLGVLCSVGLPLLLFPAGRPQSARWRWVLVAMVTGCLLMLVGSAVSTSPIVSPADASVSLVNPWGVEQIATVATDARGVGLPVVMVTTAAAVLGIVARFWSVSGAERQQLRWVRAGAILAIVGILGIYVGGGLLGLPDGLTGVAAAVGIGCIPLSFTVAILRYRLYELDRIVSRTVSYAVVTGLLIATYVGLVTAVSRFTPTSNSLAVAASTLAVAALFQPLRRRVHAAVDRRFNRTRYDATRTVDAFSLQLREQVDLDAVTADLLAIVGRTLEPATVSLWLRAGVGPEAPRRSSVPA